MFLKPADILFTTGDRFLQRAIRWSTSYYGEPETTASHVGVFTKGGGLYEAEITEALLRTGVTTSNFYQTYGQSNARMAIVRPVTIPLQERAKIAEATKHMEGKRYGAAKLIGFFMDGLMGKVFRRDVRFFRHFFFRSSTPVCSNLVLLQFFRFGYSFAANPLEGVPDDIADFAFAHPEKYKLIADWQDAAQLFKIP